MTSVTVSNKEITGKQLGIMLLALIGLLIAGGMAVNNLMVEGHAAYNTDNLGLFWGFPIVVYDYFLLTSTGLAMVASMALIFGGEDFRPIIRRALWLALAGLIGGVAVLMMELGHPLRALWAIPFSFAFSSPLYWKVMAVSFYVLSLLILQARMLKADWRMQDLRINAMVTLALALGVTAIAGVVYGSQSFRPFWASGDIPVAFIFESLWAGSPSSSSSPIWPTPSTRRRCPKALSACSTTAWPICWPWRSSSISCSSSRA
jgi:Ni/Fe-hydrogenase subunit HybB-like protein